MKNTYDEMMEDEKFVEFFKRMQSSANYYVATYDMDENEKFAVHLCIAAAYKSGHQMKGLK